MHFNEYISTSGGLLANLLPIIITLSDHDWQFCLQHKTDQLRNIKKQFDLKDTKGCHSAVMCLWSIKVLSFWLRNICGEITFPKSWWTCTGCQSRHTSSSLCMLVYTSINAITTSLTWFDQWHITSDQRLTRLPFPEILEPWLPIPLLPTVVSPVDKTWN